MSSAESKCASKWLSTADQIFNTRALQVCAEMDSEAKEPVLVDSSESEEETMSGDLRQQLRRRGPSEARFKETKSRSRRDDLYPREGSVFSRFPSSPKRPSPVHNSPKRVSFAPQVSSPPFTIGSSYALPLGHRQVTVRGHVLSNYRVTRSDLYQERVKSGVLNNKGPDKGKKPSDSCKSSCWWLIPV